MTSRHAALKTRTLRAARYHRISKDRLGLERGVDRQDEDTSARLERERDWESVGEPYVDNDTSAGEKRGRKRQQGDRPDYDRLVRDIRAGLIDVVIVQRDDRIWRDREERAEGMRIFREAGVMLAVTSGPDIDLLTASGRLNMDVVGAFSTHENEVKAERTQRALQQNAERGQPHSACAFGWRRERTMDDRGRVIGFRDVVDPVTAGIVRECVDRVLGGDSLYSIAKDLNARKIPTARYAKEWTPIAVRSLVKRPANVGIRIYQGKPFGRGDWDPIIDQAKHDRIVAMLSAPGRNKVRDSRRKHVLTCDADLACCGVCGGALVIGFRSKGRYPTYVCSKPSSCVGRLQSNVDALVDEYTIERLEQSDVIASMFTTNDTAYADTCAERDALRARLNIASDQFSDGLIDGEQLQRITGKLRPKLEAAEQRARSLAPPSLGGLHALITADDVRAAWLALDAVGKRAVLHALGCKVRILPTPRTGRGANTVFRPECVEVSWTR